MHSSNRDPQSNSPGESGIHDSSTSARQRACVYFSRVSRGWEIFSEDAVRRKTAMRLTLVASLLVASGVIVIAARLLKRHPKVETMSEEELTKKISELGEQIKQAKSENKPKEEWEPLLKEMLAAKVGSCLLRHKYRGRTR